MRHARRQQDGIGLTGALFLIALATFFLLVGMKLGPYYMEYFTVRSIMRGLTDDPSLPEQGPRGLKKAIEDRLYVNYVERVGLKDFKIKKTREGYLVSVEYDQQEHLIANVDVLMRFEHEVQVDKQ